MISACSLTESVRLLSLTVKGLCNLTIIEESWVLQKLPSEIVYNVSAQSVFGSILKPTRITTHVITYVMVMHKLTSHCDVNEPVKPNSRNSAIMQSVKAHVCDWAGEGEEQDTLGLREE